MTHAIRTCMFLTIVLGLGCHSASESEDPSPPIETGKPDAFASDPVTTLDGGAPDTGVTDDGAPDTGVTDDGAPDTGVTDDAATNCDDEDVWCRALPPMCPEGEVPSVENHCWGPCVPEAQCEPLN